MTRERPVVHLTLSPEAIALADELALADGMSRSAKIEQCIRQAGRAAGKDLKELAELGRRERRSRGLARPRKTATH